MRVLVHGGRVVDPSQGLDGAFDLLLEDGVVAKLGERIAAPKGARMVDAAGAVVAPGLIDIHVHLREPGQEYKETVRTGTMAAAAGGFTAVACMANTEPVNDNRSVTGHILAEAGLHGFARVYPIGAITKGLAGQELAEIGELIAAGAVAVSDDGHPVRNSAMMRRALEYAQHFSAVVIQHAQDMDLTAGGVMHEGEWSTRLGLPGIPGLAEDLMVARDLLLLEVTGGRYHVAHLSTARSLELVRDAKRRGLAATCEVTPHHLLLTDHAVAEREFSTDTKMNPPLRPEGDREALLRGLTDGAVDCIASDHAPHHADEKALQFELAPFGIVGLETTLPLCLDRLVRPGILSLSRLIELLSCGPARVLGIPGGTLREGSPADLTLVDLEAPFSVHASEFRSKGRNTPFEGWSGVGRARLTIVGGRVVELPGRDD